MDDQMNLAVGTGYDFVIKKKAEEIDSQKLENNVVMDELVEKLGYMDYRDALACNKYIIEAKKSGDYHQVARARILQIAFSRMDQDKRTKIQRASRQEAKESGKQAEQIQLETIMDENSEFAEMYRDTFAEEKRSKEVDTQRIDDVHERFDYFKDEGRMARKIKDPRFDLKGELPDTEDECFTTDFDEGIDL